MAQQYTLVARPVILSENKTNVIPHGKPLSPIGTVRSSRPFFVPRQIKGSYVEEKHGDTISVEPSRIAICSSTSLSDYHKAANENLMTINNNLSLMLKESFAGIDSICQKVRLCLLEANTLRPDTPCFITSKSQLTALEIRTSPDVSIRTAQSRETRSYENLDKRTEYRRGSFQALSSLSTCDEEGDSKLHELPDIPEDGEDIVADIVEENEEEDDDVQKNQNKEQNEEKKPKRTRSITPFFTILNQPTQSVESIGVTIIRSMSKIGISSKCTSENFQKTMIEVEKLTDYEQFLTSMVEGINKEIDECYSKFPKFDKNFLKEYDNNGSKDEKKNNGKKNNKPNNKQTSSKGKKQRGELGISPDLKRFHEVHKIQRELLEDQFSENDLTFKDRHGRRLALSVSTGRMDFTCPDVYRKRAITDLHKRLKDQIEANDSLIFFQKLMAKSKKHINSQRPITCSNSGDKPTESNKLKSPIQYLLTPNREPEEKKQRSLSDLTRKYKDSLWFRQKKPELKRNKKELLSQKKRNKQGKKDKRVLPVSYTVESSPSEGSKTHKNSSPIEGGKIHKNSSHTEGSRTHKNCSHTEVSKTYKPLCMKSPSQATICNCKIKVTNDQPMSGSQKCKLHWMRTKYSQMCHKKLKYLDILDDITKNDLLPIKAEYPRRDEIKCTGVKTSYLYKLMYGKNTETQNAWDQLFQPSTKCSQENCPNCKETTIITKEEQDQKNNELNNLKNQAYPKMERNSDFEKGDVISKLSKYIFVEGTDKEKNKKPVFTVMPVHVFYDNSRITSPNRKSAEMPQKLPLIPMKETKEFVKKAEWNDAAAKRTKPVKIVYDPILRKIEKEIRSVNVRAGNKAGHSKFGQTNSWSPKNFSQYCQLNHQSHDYRAATVKMDPIEKPAHIQRTFTVPNSTRTPELSELFRRTSKTSPEKSSHHLSATLCSPNTFNKYQQDMDIKQSIQNPVGSQARALMKSEKQRKFWEYKYGKSTGQKLLNFIEKQPSPYQTPIPKHALPKFVPVHHPTKHHMMLEQLRNLKQKNDNIQTNIQKAINVIEQKMVDILSRPSTSASIEAFDEMEKEITNVLSLMKGPGHPKSPGSKNQSRDVNEYKDDISDELFQRLDKILESPGVSSSGRSSGNSILRKEDNAKRKSKVNTDLPRKSTDMNEVRFSSTSATGEEKFTITAISPKRPFKPSTIAPHTQRTPGVRKCASSISNELRRLEKELRFKAKSEYISQRTTEPETTTDSELTKGKTMLKTTSLLQQSRIPDQEQEQVVNLALFPQGNREGSAGDQLQELEKLLENELKSFDGDEERSYSLVVSFSQGDYEMQNVKDKKTSLATPENTEVDLISSMEGEETKGQYFPKLVEENERIHDETTEKQRLEAAPEKPKEIPVPHQETIAAQQGSQLSLDVTGPYFTPLTSPLDKTRCPIIEEEKPSLQIEKCETSKPGDQIKDGGDQQSHQRKEDSQKENGEKQKTDTKEDLRSKICGDSKEIDELSGTIYKEEDETKDSYKDEFYENVNKIISRVENVYNQLEEFETEMLQEEEKLKPTPYTGKVPVFQDDRPPKIVEMDEADLYLTPFIEVVKDLKKSIGSDSTQDSRRSSPRMNRSSSLYNVLTFLDSLAEFKLERAIEVHTPRLCYFSYMVHIPQTFNQATIYHPISLFNPSLPRIVEEPKRKGGCLKIPASHSNVNTVSSKSKQKVSFFLQKEEKSTQVKSCLFHNVASLLSQQINTSTDTSFLTESSERRDEQVSACLDACKNQSVDKMSLADDEGTYQSTFDFSEDNCSDKIDYQMPEQFIPTLQETLEKEAETATDTKKNVVEIFRNNNPEESNTVGIKVFSEKKDKNEGKSRTNENDKIVEASSEEVYEEAFGDVLEEPGKVKGFSERVEEAVITNSEASATLFEEPPKVKVFSEKVPKIPNSKSPIKVFYDNYKPLQSQIDLKLIAGFYNEDSILQVQNSLSKDLTVKRRNSLEKLLKDINEKTFSAEILKESGLFQPLNDVNKFIDSKLLKEAVEKRQAVRMMRRKSSVAWSSRGETSMRMSREVHLVCEAEKENLLKGFYVFVYLLMFTALNLEYKCVQ